mmetsp:Transcript_18057/g.37815  ORF Transcript_18057/g.37815 Transcript_18057/m.37815 type:complete len:319 (+) Transcript_18057:276-1232(+)
MSGPTARYGRGSSVLDEGRLERRQHKLGRRGRRGRARLGEAGDNRQQHCGRADDSERVGGLLNAGDGVSVEDLRDHVAVVAASRGLADLLVHRSRQLRPDRGHGPGGHRRGHSATLEVLGGDEARVDEHERERDEAHRELVRRRAAVVDHHDVDVEGGGSGEPREVDGERDPADEVVRLKGRHAGRALHGDAKREEDAGDEHGREHDLLLREGQRPEGLEDARAHPRPADALLDDVRRTDGLGALHDHEEELEGEDDAPDRKGVTRRRDDRLVLCGDVLIGSTEDVGGAHEVGDEGVKNVRRYIRVVQRGQRGVASHA